ncbi:hypothetical protein AEQ67_18685 [Pseudomonas sp. RIT-PI-q]|uniref:methylenetetrahydrofolate reductase n=1 Tax=Pseudomonas sp. RIT-PI-q TaxID=1690247 RepID=UPI0006CCB1D6|nr:methylenetetrahydrofolate reductase [Pseudomonas sp. RIT-PI-q]KPG95970.1 hypothetical protein AEQ67_18685 [Pseudomonas sp. RIT-PI-q]
MAIRSQLFEGGSLEATAKDVFAFPHARATMLQGVTVNIAFIGNETFYDRLNAIDSLLTLGARPRPIISARRIASREELGSILSRSTEERGVREVFLVGGDPSTPKGPFIDSMDIINGNFLNPKAIQTVGITGYPEGHPHIEDEVLWTYLKLKVNTLLALGFKVEITTQLSFDINTVVTWIEQVRSEGIHVPIRVGIPSPTSIEGIINFARICRVRTSVNLLQRFGWQLTSILSRVGPDRFLDSLFLETQRRDLGEIRLHMFPLGNLFKALTWFQKYGCGT